MSDVSASVRDSVRDSLRINVDEELEEAVNQDASRRKLREGLSRLPVPKNDFEIVVPEEDRSDAVTEFTDDMDMTPDADDLESQQRTVEEERRKLEWSLRSQVVQRDLPRPAVISSKVDLVGIADDRVRAETLVQVSERPLEPIISS